MVAAGLEGARRDWPQTPFTADLEPCVVVGSAERLQIAVRNLLDNAAKFGPPGAPVEVRLVGGELTVRDHGPGIAAADLPHVFDRFYRAASARAVPGSGLGLSIVRQVAESHGGTVRAESAPGGGTLIRLRLPGRASPDPGAPLSGSAPSRPAPLPPRCRSGNTPVADDRARLIGLRRRGTDAVLSQDPRYLAGDPCAAGCGGVKAVMRARERPSRRQRIDDDHVAVRGPAGRHDRMVGPVGGGRARASGGVPSAR